MLLCRILSIPAMLGAVCFLVLFALFLLVFLFVPLMVCCRENGVKAWIITVATIVGIPFVIFSVLWAIVGAFLWVLLVPCGAGAVHLQFFLGVPLMTTLAICEGIVGPEGLIGPGAAAGRGSRVAPANGGAVRAPSVATAAAPEP
jgi:hypothetical protein